MKIKRVTKKLFNLETYENLLVGFLRFFINRSPITLWFWLAYFLGILKGTFKDIFLTAGSGVSPEPKISSDTEKGAVSTVKLKKQKVQAGTFEPAQEIFSKKTPLTPLHKRGDHPSTQIKAFNQKHPYASATSSFLTIIFIISTLSYIFIFQNSEEAGAAWWNDQWLYRKELTINSSQVTADLQNFPMLVSLTDANLGTHAQTDADDIIFIDDQGQKLSHEIESYTTGTGVLVAWVKIPNLDADNDSNIHMYYGNASTNSQQDAENVWDENYKMVQHMNESGTGTRYDSTSNNNDLGTSSYSGDEAISNSKINGADDLELDSSESLARSDDDSLDITGELTISAWIRQETVASGGVYRSLVGKQDGGSNNNYTFSTYNDELYFGFYNGGSQDHYTASANLVAGTWYHVVITYNDGANNVTIYVNNNAELNTTENNSLLTNGDVLEIGIENIGTYFDGVIDEIRISSSTRSADWIATEYANQNAPGTFLTAASEEVGPGPVGYWTFDEGYGSTAHDSSGQGNDGTVYNAQWKGDEECLSGKCMYFDGDDDYVEIADSDELDLLDNEYTIMAWIRPVDWGNNSQGRIIDHGGGSTGSAGWTFQVDNNEVVGGLVLQRNGSSDGKSNASIIELNSWQLAVVTVSGGVATFYVDGVEGGTDTFGALTDRSDPIRIGMRATDLYREFKGFIDEVKIYPYARTTDQIKADHAAGLAGVKSTSGIAASFGGAGDGWLSDGLVGYWKMDESSWNGTTNEVVDSSGNNNNGTAGANDSGTSTGSNTSTTLNDTAKSWTVNAYANHNLTITAGTGSGQTRAISSNTATALTVSTAWTTTPDATSTYRITGTTGTGKFGNGGVFDNVADYVEVADDDALDVGVNDFTVVAWAKHTSTFDSDNVLVGKMHDMGSSNSGIGWVLFLNGGGSYGFGINKDAAGDDTEINSNDNNYDDGKWHHVAAIVDRDGNVDFVIDGEAEGSGSVADEAGSLDNATPLLIGADYNGAQSPDPPNREWHGEIDEVRVYNRALSPGEVKKLYQWAPGPVAHWKMDEKVKGDAQTIYDNSGNGNDGTTDDGANDTGMDCSVRGKYGSACEFDGTDDDISVSNSEDFNSSDLTVAFWMNPATLNDNDRIITKYDGLSSMDWTIEYFGNLYMKIGENAADSILGGSLDPAINEWTHVAITKNGTSWTLYGNGTIESQGTSSTTWTNSENIYFASYNGSASYQGLLDDIRIYNYARTQDQIIEDMNAGHPVGGSPVPSQVAYWKFDEGYGATAYDSAGSSNGTLDAGSIGTNTTTTAMWDLDGKFGKAIELDGTDDYIDVGDISALEGMDELTVSMWIKPESTGTYDELISKYNSYYFDFSSGCRFVTFADSAVTLNCTTIPTNEWIHLTGVYDGQNMYVYQDGKFDASIAQTGSIDTNAYSVCIGAGGSGGCASDSSKFDGLVDEVKIYNVALTAEQVRTEYNQGKAQVLGQPVEHPTGATGQGMEYCVPGDSSTCNPPVLELNFDEMIGTTVYDTSGNGNDGTLTSGPVWTRGKHGSALEFDGSDDYVDVGSGINLTSSDFTYQAWVKVDDFTDDNVIISNEDSNDNGVMRVDTSGSLQFWVGSGAVDKRTAVNTILADNWYHVAFVYDDSANDGDFYLNGIRQVNSLDDDTLEDLSAGQNLYIGIRSYGPYDPFDGSIDNVKIYNYIRTPAQIAWDYNRGKPVAHWKFDETSGTTAHDESGNGNDGTLTNMDPGTDWVSGKLNNALDLGGAFDGGDDYVQTTSDVLKTANSFTVTTWFKVDATNEYNTLLWQGDATGNGGGEEEEFNLNVGHATTNGIGNQLEFFLEGTSDDIAILTGQNSFTDTTNWHFIAVTVSGLDTASPSAELFLDGASQGTDSGDTVTRTNWDTDLRIGRPGVADRYFDGQVDDVRIYNYALTKQQIKEIYNNGAVSFR